MTKLVETPSDVLPTLNKKNVAYPPQPPPCNVVPLLLPVENNKTSVCDKHDRGITSVIVVILNWHYCVLVLYENICSKEGEVWQKMFSNKIFLMLVTQGLPSFFALPSCCISKSSLLSDTIQNIHPNMQLRFWVTKSQETQLSPHATHCSWRETVQKWQTCFFQLQSTRQDKVPNVR